MTSQHELASLVARLLPDQAEVLGLVVLMRLHIARSGARFDTAGEIVLLPEQDRSRWDSAAIADAVEVLNRAAAMGAHGPYQLQAAITAVHARARSWRETDWSQIVALYDALLRLTDTPVVRLNRAVARSQVSGPRGRTVYDATESIERVALELGVRSLDQAAAH